MDSLDLENNRLANSEEVGRILFDPYSLSDDGSEVSPAAFMLRDLKKELEDYLSVHRTSRSPLTMELACSLIKRPPKENVIYGYALLLAEDIHEASHLDATMHTVPIPTAKDSDHAGIYVLYGGIKFEGAGCANDPVYNKAAEYLAKISDLQKFE